MQQYVPENTHFLSNILLVPNETFELFVDTRRATVRKAKRTGVGRLVNVRTNAKSFRNRRRVNTGTADRKQSRHLPTWTKNASRQYNLTLQVEEQMFVPKLGRFVPKLGMFVPKLGRFRKAK